MTLDISMSKAQYILGEPIYVNITAREGADVKITVRHLADEPVPYYDGMIPPSAGGYGVDAVIDGTPVSTAFDVVRDWRERIRYGFLSDFAEKDRDGGGDVEWLKKAHFNAVQFYDWMYRHETLLPPEPEYADPLGRSLSYLAVLEKINDCKENGIKPMAYGAVYAASRPFWEKRRTWGLYCRNGSPMSFGGWLQFMDVSRGSPWREHILSEFSRSVREAGFSGLHMDTYGYPKNAYNAYGAPVDLAEEFPSLIGDVKATISPETGVIFNCVGNWPVEAVAKSSVDAVYIEVWPPCERYAHLVSLIRDGLIFGEKKPVILAAYMSPFKTAKTSDEIAAAENALLLAFSVIHASGGTQLTLGENACVLCDPYYAEHRALRPEFLPELHRYLDHAVRTCELTDMRQVEEISAEFTGGINTEITFEGAACGPFPEMGKIWTTAGRTRDKYILQLVNLTRLEHDCWNEPQKRPEAVKNLSVEVLADYDIKGVYAANPDSDGGRPQCLPYTVKETERGQTVCFTVPTVTIWTTVWIEFEP